MKRMGWVVAGLVLAAGVAFWWSSDDKSVEVSAPSLVAASIPQPSAPGNEAPSLQTSAASAPMSLGGSGSSGSSLYRLTAQDVALVQQALAGGEPDQALQAAGILTRCATADRDVRDLFWARDHHAAELSTSGFDIGAMIGRAQAFQRACQAFDAATHARTGELFAQAHAGGASGAALQYLRWLQREGGEPPPSGMVATLQREVRSEAEAGDFPTLSIAVLSSAPDLGLNAVERAGFERAWLRIRDADGGSGGMERYFKSRGAVQLSPEQDAQAEALAKQVIAAHQRRK